MASGSQISVEANQSTTLGSQGASSGSNTKLNTQSAAEMNTQSAAEMMASWKLNPLAKDFVPSSNLRINPNQGLNRLSSPYHQMYPGMQFQGYPNHHSSVYIACLFTSFNFLDI